MRDPREGVAADGTIRTGVDRRRIPAPYKPLLGEVVAGFGQLDRPGAELHLYGSVATGTARPGESDVDLVVIGGDADWAAEVSAHMSSRYAGLCRGVDIAAAEPADHTGDGDEAYGNRVFLRHYCVALAGPDAIRSPTPFPADVRAARGFNGDIPRALRRWRTDGAPAPRIARKTLVAAAGIVSVRTGGWTTDRAAAVAAWSDVAADERPAMERLLRWSSGVELPTEDDVDAALADGGIVASVVARFVREIGAWA